ncbi:MAG: glutamine synthetase [Actinobacteria bacterium]|nr:MAG: glutamine synthetase [Actinomycetota bacterium]RIK06016.1 MAG: glutamine synthetase [Acidobacteriota bacterium]
MLDVAELRRLVDVGEIDTVVVGFPDLYGRLMGKRFDAEYFLDHGAEHGTHACDYLLTVDMEMEPVPGYRYANWEEGYGDLHMAPDLPTLRLATWLDRTALVICDTEDEATHQPVAVAPRSILRAQIAAAGSAGFDAVAASELEYYIFRNSYREAAELAYTGLTPMGWYIEDYHLLQPVREEHFTAAVRRHLRDSGIPVENSKGEWGKGQHELNVRYADVLEMADRHVIFKQCLKETAELLDMSVTFMAKPRSGAAGSSCHVHLSLWSGDDNAFAGNDRVGRIDCSDHFRHFLGGWMAHVPDLMVFYASNVNSYKRYEDGSWAPTRLAWSYDNRTAGFRVVGSGDSLRIECRIPGADCNPYLVYAAALASGLDGIANRIEPPPIFEGDAYRAEEIPLVPRSLRDATELFAASDFARQAFGDEVVDHYTHFFRVEQDAYDRAVTDWERGRYFERI